MGEDATPLTDQTSTEENIEALLEAARYDDLEDVKSLETIGVSLVSKDSMGRTALHMAAANGHLDVVEYLINKGVLIVRGPDTLLRFFHQEPRSVSEPTYGSDDTEPSPRFTLRCTTLIYILPLGANVKRNSLE